MADVDKIKAVKDRVEQQLMSLEGVIGVGVGLKKKNGALTDEVVIRVYVKQKKPMDNLKPEQVVPAQLEGHNTDVVELGALKLLAGPDSARYRPMQPGSEVAVFWPDINMFLQQGSLTCFVESFVENLPGWQVVFPPGYEPPSEKFFITCSHVVSPEDNLQQKNLGAFVYQPAITFVAPNMVGIVRSQVYGGKADAALIKLNTGPGYKEEDAKYGKVFVNNALGSVGRLTGIAKLGSSFNQAVRMYGRTSGYVEGKVDSAYSNLKSGLNNILSISTTSSVGKGDSGAPIVNSNQELVGVLVGMAETSSTLAFASEAAAVVDALSNELTNWYNASPKGPAQGWRWGLKLCEPMSWHQAPPLRAICAASHGGSHGAQFWGANLNGAIVTSYQATPGAAFWEGWGTVPFDGLTGVACLAACQQGDNDPRLHLWALTQDGRLYTKYQLSAGGYWSSGWEGPGWRGAPNNLRRICAASQGGRPGAQLWGVDDNEKIWTIYQPTAGGDWSGWNVSDFVGLNAVSLAAAQMGSADNRVILWGLTYDGKLYCNYQVQRGGNWSGWEGPSWRGAPNLTRICAASQGGRTGAQLWGVDEFGKIWTIYQPSAGGDWSPWNAEDFGGVSGIKDLAASQQGNGDRRVELWAIDSEYRLLTKYQKEPGGSWSDWES
jgi:hypothetical protein